MAKRAKAARGPARQVANPTGLPTCEADCTRPSTVFACWKWWCDRHNPGTTPAANCGHSLRSMIHGKLTCSWCGGQDEEWT